jgi:hypothetical protein
MRLPSSCTATYGSNVGRPSGPALRPGAIASPAAVAASLHRLADALQAGDHELAQTYAEAVLEVAVKAAGLRPTPQARMAASGLTATEGAIVGEGGTSVSGRGGSASLDDLLPGAELGSALYPQFGPSTGGSWLAGTIDDPGAGPQQAGEDWLAELLARIG